MRIGIDGHVLGKNIGGVERFVRELVQQLPVEAPQHTYIVFVTKAEYAKLQINSQASKQSPLVTYVALAFANTMLQRLILLPWLVHRHRLDALLVQRLAPWFCGSCQLIATIHDLTPIKFAQSYAGLSNKLVRLLTKNTIKRASLILTPTNAVREEILHYYPQVTAPVVAFYNGVDTTSFRQSTKNEAFTLPISKPYLLTVGAIESRKNLETIFDLLPLLKNHPTIQLAVVGAIRDQTYFDALKTQLAHAGLTHRVHYMGFMDEQALISLYQHAAVFISASKDEGFNIPPLEAMACGTPVVCSNITVHVELFSNAALFYETESAKDLAEKVETILENATILPNLLAQGYAKVAEFTWQRTAKNVAAALKLLSPNKPKQAQTSVNK